MWRPWAKPGTFNRREQPMAHPLHLGRVLITDAIRLTRSKTHLFEPKTDISRLAVDMYPHW